MRRHIIDTSLIKINHLSIMIKYYIYIGSNNETHKLETAQAISIISKYFEGFTAYEVIGYWKGSKENTLKIEVASEENNTKVIRLCKELKKELQQEAILLEQISSNIAFIQ